MGHLDRAGVLTGYSNLSGLKISILTDIGKSNKVTGLSAAYFEVGLIIVVRLLACNI